MPNLRKNSSKSKLVLKKKKERELKKELGLKSLENKPEKLRFRPRSKRQQRERDLRKNRNSKKRVRRSLKRKITRPRKQLRKLDMIFLKLRRKKSLPRMNKKSERLKKPLRKPKNWQRMLRKLERRFKNKKNK